MYGSRIGKVRFALSGIMMLLVLFAFRHAWGIPGLLFYGVLAYVIRPGNTAWEREPTSFDARPHGLMNGFIKWLAYAAGCAMIWADGLEMLRAMAEQLMQSNVVFVLLIILVGCAVVRDFIWGGYSLDAASDNSAFTAPAGGRRPTH